MDIQKPIHPFPARMAPTIALDKIKQLPQHSVVLDPMMGSGTVVRAATDQGHRALGCDVDPLAVLMTRVWTTPICGRTLRAQAEQIVCAAQRLTSEAAQLPWVDDDPATQAFIDYWFGLQQQDALRRLSAMLHPRVTATDDALRLALSRVIITKNHGASLARDVSHSRPHRAFTSNDYQVYDGFLQAVEQIARRLEQAPPRGHAEVAHGDARQLGIPDATIDAVITSPPYLNAIDYLRGHRLALVWLGYQIGALRTIRSGSIGAERRPDPTAERAVATAVIEQLGIQECLPTREHGMVERYILDLSAMLAEVHRVLRPGGTAVFVLGNSCIRGTFVQNSLAVSTLAEQLGFQLLHQRQRTLPPSRRYMPPPTNGGTTTMARRMRTEIVLTYERP